MATLAKKSKSLASKQQCQPGQKTLVDIFGGTISIRSSHSTSKFEDKGNKMENNLKASYGSKLKHLADPKDLNSSSAVALGDSKLRRLFGSISCTSWTSLLSDEFQKPYMVNIGKYLDDCEKKGLKVFPPASQIFSAFNLTPFDDIRVVLLGQDPYHNDGQAHGLCFSVPIGQPPPPSLRNVYTELSQEFPDFKPPNHGCLTEWARQGVFLLNATLTVQAHKANSHSDIGWQRFTDVVIRLISSKSKRGIVFLLWGNFAHKKDSLIDQNRHCIIKTAHPSPLSAARFRGCRCFTRTNDALVNQFSREPIDWTNSLHSALPYL